MTGEVRDIRPSNDPPPLPPIWVMLEYGMWPTEDDRDRSQDVTDEQITEWI